MPLLLLTNTPGGASSGGTPPATLPPASSGGVVALSGPSMRLYRAQYTTDYLTGTLSGVTLDGVIYASQYGHTAVTPQPVTTFTTVTGAQAIATSPQPPATGLPTMAAVNTQGAGSTAFHTVGTAGQPGTAIAYTYQSGDGVQFTTTTRAVQIQLAGTLQGGTFGAPATAGSVRNGAIATLIVDGAIAQTIDTANAAPLLTLYLDGNSHAVQIVHSGAYGNATHPISSVTTYGAGGASVASGTLLTPLTHPTFVAASWRLAQVTDGAHYALYRTLPGGNETLVVTALVTGTHYTAYVPGVDLFVSNNSPLTAGDQATFTTDVTTLAIESIAIGTGTGVGGSTYTTPVLDSGDPLNQWFLAEWDEDPGMTPMASVTLSVGQTPTPDASWTTVTITPSATILPSGRGFGTAGLLVTGVPRGRSALLQFTFPSVSTLPVWIRDLCIYGWTPERDPQILSKVGLPEEAAVGPLMAAYIGTLAVTATELRQDVYDFVNSFGIQNAVDQYLAAHGADRNIPRYAGEPPQSYRTRLLAASASRTTEASPSGLCGQIAQLVTGTTAGLTSSVSGGYTTATCQGVIVAQGSGQSAHITIPSPPYAGLPGLTVAQAQTVILAHIKTIAPLATVIFPGGTGSNVVFT